MRLNDLSDGSIKTLLILILLAANIAVALAHHRTSPQLPPPGSADASPALFGAPPKSSSHARRVSRGARDTAGEAPALSGEPPRQP